MASYMVEYVAHNGTKILVSATANNVEASSESEAREIAKKRIIDMVNGTELSSFCEVSEGCQIKEADDE